MPVVEGQRVAITSPKMRSWRENCKKRRMHAAATEAQVMDTTITVLLARAQRPVKHTASKRMASRRTVNRAVLRHIATRTEARRGAF